jgi:hypothetical protein
MKRTWTIIGVTDVAGSFKWYQSMALQRARQLVPRLDEEPYVNCATGTREFALRDPDGYHLMVSALG